MTNNSKIKRNISTCTYCETVRVIKSLADCRHCFIKHKIQHIRTCDIRSRSRRYTNARRKSANKITKESRDVLAIK